MVRREQADAAGLPYDVVAAWITLTVHSALDAVGLTAAAAGKLAAARISCNVIAARPTTTSWCRATERSKRLTCSNSSTSDDGHPAAAQAPARRRGRAVAADRAHPPWNDAHADLHRAVTGSASTVLADIDWDGLLGTAMVGHDGHRGWVYYPAVRPAEQRCGLGLAHHRRHGPGRGRPGRWAASAAAGVLLRPIRSACTWYCQNLTSGGRRRGTVAGCPA